MKAKQYFIVGCAALVIALGAIIVISLNRSSEKSVVARIGYLKITASLPLFIAEEKGFFNDENIQIETYQIATSNTLVDGIVAGSLDMFIEASAVPVLAVEHISPGRLKVFSVSSITRSAPFDTLLVKKDSTLVGLSDLPGTKIGVFPGSTATNLLKKFLVDQGVNVDDITFVPMPPQNHLTALLEGSVDVIHAYEPTTAIAHSLGDTRQIFGSVYAEMLDRNPQGVAALSTKFLANNPEAARKVVYALERAMIFMREQEGEARQILEKRMGLSTEVANRSIFLYMLPHREVDISIFQEYADMLTDLGELQGRVNVTDLLYNE